MEDEARKYYALVSDAVVQRVGFVTLDNGKAGASPDGFVGEDGGVELKCPAAHTHVGYLLDPSSLVWEYRGQVQGNLYITGRKWWDLVAYNLPSIVERVRPDDEYQDRLHKVLTAFIANLDEMKDRLAAHRVALEAA
jgi:exodeoxyribonuclease (lambda-induced)